ncbi:fumarylacetoacetate hydrolase family protein [Pseudorhodoferax sp.]|uniref:fumarylacetoacetate hydrolase family protein n=1 Tax=Pseudorhodoferax sp. TaxID=1993553 RepID=UPI002DD68E22|nr:fumarylacetoacetate hydrolase family protein [Pseudorhodoferax sp.]
MKLGTFEHRGRAVPVLHTGLGIVDLQAASGHGTARAGGWQPPPGFQLLDLIGAGEPGLAFAHQVLADEQACRAATLDPTAGRWLAPLPQTPRNVFCVGRNYADHVHEDNTSRDLATPLPEHPQFFTKPPTAIVGPDADVRLDERVTRRLDYEVELAVVVGRGGRDIDADDALAHVFGYTIVNDVTARDLQRRHDQWFKGKALDTSCPMGPWIVTADEIPDPHALQIRLWVNDELRQDASTAQMIFRIPQTMAALSAGLTLLPGDVLATGTPSGVGYAMNPRRFLADGDVMSCEVQGIGQLRNTVRAVR